MGIKVRVKKEFPQLKDILPLNFETELTAILSTEEKIIGRELTRFNSKTKKHEVVFPEVVAPIGNYEGSRFIGANGETYTDDIITQFIGPRPFTDIFEKI
jgi:hypothetical protein